MRSRRRFFAAWRAIERKGVVPIPPARNTAGRKALPCSTIMPFGPSTCTGRPGDADLSTRLNAVLRMRVAIISSGSSGAEASVNVRLGFDQRHEHVLPRLVCEDGG